MKTTEKLNTIATQLTGILGDLVALQQEKETPVEELTTVYIPVKPGESLKDGDGWFSDAFGWREISCPGQPSPNKGYLRPIQIPDLLTEISALKEKLEQYRWIPVEEREPTEEDGGVEKEILQLLDDGRTVKANWDDLWKMTHWIRIPPAPELTPVPEKSELEKAREEFEEVFKPRDFSRDGEDGFYNDSYTDGLWCGWKKAKGVQ